MDATVNEIKQEHPPVESRKIEYQEYFSGFWIRFWAYLLDLLIIMSINGILVNPVFRLAGWETSGNMFAPVSIIKAIVFFGYFVLLTKYLGQTLGKMTFGIRVVSLHPEGLSWKTILFRELVGRYISKTIFIGYIITAFTKKKQGLHDLFADTAVIHQDLYLKKETMIPASNTPQ
ncbi:RDD family protein [Bacillus lacus]|uniref:RDD family protein n=1 Tax=Metabacillus lacus TaxID=1983721 RepID=A0A7X2IY00_9BACI|nr:RDD family protein [Metabacillus lacus]MRX71725.1 RDD family protein [Metabacillus lacus]